MALTQKLVDFLAKFPERFVGDAVLRAAESYGEDVSGLAPGIRELITQAPTPSPLTEPVTMTGYHATKAHFEQFLDPENVPLSRTRSYDYVNSFMGNFFALDKGAVEGFRGGGTGVGKIMEREITFQNPYVVHSWASMNELAQEYGSLTKKYTFEDVQRFAEQDTRNYRTESRNRAATRIMDARRALRTVQESDLEPALKEYEIKKASYEVKHAVEYARGDRIPAKRIYGPEEIDIDYLRKGLEESAGFGTTPAEIKQAVADNYYMDVQAPSAMKRDVALNFRKRLMQRGYDAVIAAEGEHAPFIMPLSVSQIAGNEPIQKAAAAVGEMHGPPIPGYHGTSKRFERFVEPEERAITTDNWLLPNAFLGNWFSQSMKGAERFAGEGGHVLERELSVFNPMHFESEGMLDRAITKHAFEQGMVSRADLGNTDWFKDWHGPPSREDVDDYLNRLRGHVDLQPGDEHVVAKLQTVSKSYRESLQSQGYDAISLQHATGPAVVPLSAKQISPRRLSTPVAEKVGRVVGFAGYSRTGKDAAADVLVQQGFERLPMSAPLMKEALDRNPVIGGRPLSHIVDEIGWERAKDEVPEVRPILVGIGNEWRAAHGQDYLTRLALDQRDPTKNYVATGLRFQGEVDKVNEMGGAVLRVNRPGIGAANESETQIGELTGVQDIQNDRTLRVLHARAERASLGPRLGPRKTSSARRAEIQRQAERQAAGKYIDEP